MTVDQPADTALPNVADGPDPRSPMVATPMRALPSLMRKLWTDRLALLSDAADEYGDAVRFRMGPKTLYFFNHPDHAKYVLADNAANYHKGIGLTEAKRLLGEGLLTSEGELWRKQRRTIQPAFRRDRLGDFAGLIAGEADALVSRLESKVGDGPVDVVAEMTRLTLRVLGAALLDADLSPFIKLGGSFEEVQDQAMFEMVTLRMLPIWLPIPRHRRFHVALRELEDAAMALVDEREASAKPGSGDMITRLLDAYRDEPDPSVRRRRLRDELLTILLAGHETTASTLSWTWYLVDQHPEVAERMREEALQVLGDRLPVLDDLNRLPYTTMVIQETMRLYPPVWALTRRALADDEVCGHHVPAGADIMISPYTLHRHPRYWPDPQRFDPLRFQQANADVTHRYAYIPFGAGPRVCVGSHLGMMEATFVASMVARRFRLGLVPGREVKPEAMLSLRVHGGLPMLVRPA